MFSSFSSFVFDNPSLYHCTFILNSSCISPSPVTRRSPSLLLVIPGLPVIVFGCSPLLGCHLQFPFLPMCLSLSECKRCFFVCRDCVALFSHPKHVSGKKPGLQGCLCLWQVTVWMLLPPKHQCVLKLQPERACVRTEVLTTLLFSYDPCCIGLLCLIHLVAIWTLPELLPKPMNPLCQSSFAAKQQDLEYISN